MALTVTASGTSSVSVLPSRNRERLIFENSDANICYVLLDSGTASSSNFSFSLAAAGDPGANAEIVGYHGAVQAIWGGDGTGSLMTTEY
jgi:hypothetical protein